ncbi:type II secretion system F family protein [Thalassoroseus pseudoceratinae]|uniref:type II secretion system F family protein n=1 Tax=Thalassoroseus pseudoceratinae TaxID=2713176 RepID=UPI0014219165|nr:type II secretion system F family protein [Thalassoroseus pseudoceratinae]
MLPPWMLIAFYVVLGLAIVLLLARYFRKRKLRTESDSASTTEEVPADAIQFDDPNISYAPAGPVTWNDRHLFRDGSTGTKRDRTENPLPRLEAGDVPTSDQSDYMLGPVTPVFAAMLPESDAKKRTIKRELLNAGQYNPHAYENLAALRYLGIMLPLIGIGILLIVLPTQLEVFAIAMLLVIPLMGWAIPRLVIRGQARDRMSEIARGMPDMLDMLNMCVSQGMTVPAALKRISQEIRPVYPALSRELQIVVEQAHLGSLEQALRNFSERVDLPEVHSFATLLIQTERMGSSVSAALTDYSDNMRETLRQRADEKANQATFKLLFPTVLCLMPAVFLFLLGPAMISLNDFFQGDGADLLNNSSQQLQEFREGE